MEEKERREEEKVGRERYLYLGYERYWEELLPILVLHCEFERLVILASLWLVFLIRIHHDIGFYSTLVDNGYVLLCI